MSRHKQAPSPRMEPSMTTQEFYDFGPFRLDANKRTCRRGEEAVPLAGKAFDLLLLLLRDPGRVLTKAELMAALWPDTAVEESNLTQTIFLLRKVLGDDSGNARYIQTLPRLGYKFVAPVTSSGDVHIPATKPVGRAWLWIAGGAHRFGRNGPRLAYGFCRDRSAANPLPCRTAAAGFLRRSGAGALFRFHHGSLDLEPGAH